MYHGELTAADSVKDRRLDDLATVETTLEDEELLSRVIFYDTTGLDFFERTDEDAIGVRGDSKYNENEAEVVTRHVKALGKGIRWLICPLSSLIGRLTLKAVSQLILVSLKRVSASSARIQLRWRT